MSNWLNAKKVSLNVKKAETIIFKCGRKKSQGVIKLILNRQRIHPPNNVKYLGTKIDENLHWKHHVNDVSTKFIRANANLFKIRNYVNLKILRSTKILRWKKLILFFYLFRFVLIHLANRIFFYLSQFIRI